MTPPAGSARNAGGQSSGKAKVVRSGAEGRQKKQQEDTLTVQQAISLQEDLKAGFSTEDFQRKLKELEAKFGERSPAFMKERSRLFMTVQSQVLPRHGFPGNFEGLLRAIGAFVPFHNDPGFIRATNDVCCLLGLYEQCLPEATASAPPAGAAPPPSEEKRSDEGDVVDDEPAPRGGRAILNETLHLYYMNVQGKKHSTSDKRRTIQESINPLMAAGQGYVLVPHRVAAVTPDSDVWKKAKEEYGQLVMNSHEKDSWAGSAANCILLSFLEALRVVEEENSEPDSPAYVVISEDDMMLETSFKAILEASVEELELDPQAMGAMLHSNSLAENLLQSLLKGPALRRLWPRYPAVPVVKRREGTTWPGQPVIPDQPLVCLLKTSRLREFREMYENRLRYSGWSPLDWLLANSPFGESGVLRLVHRNGFCKDGVKLGTGSVRTEQHDAMERALGVAAKGPRRPQTGLW